jgi:hypothetical protein
LAPRGTERQSYGAFRDWIEAIAGMISALASHRRTAVAASGEDAMEQFPAALCTHHLGMLGRALATHERDHAELPGLLSDLYSEYGADPALFHCPADVSAGHPGPSCGPVDEKLSRRYFYEMSAFYRSLGPVQSFHLVEEKARSSELAATEWCSMARTGSRPAG